jgi:hypothetical protein
LQLKKEFPYDALPRLPGKKLWGDNFEPGVVP